MPEKARLVVDASLAVDLFAARSRERVEAAEAVFRCLSERGVQLYAPRLFLVEAVGVLVRFLPPRLVETVADRLREEVTLVGDEVFHEEAVEAALATGSRGADAYYIGLARVLDAVLATSDRVQAVNATRLGVRAYYVLNPGELEELLRELGCGPPGRGNQPGT